MRAIVEDASHDTFVNRYLGAISTRWCKLFISNEVLLQEANRNSTEVLMNFGAFLQIEQFDRGESAESSETQSDAQKYCRKRSRHFFEFRACGSEKEIICMYDSLSTADGPGNLIHISMDRFAVATENAFGTHLHA